MLRDIRDIEITREKNNPFFFRLSINEKKKKRNKNMINH